MKKICKSTKVFLHKAVKQVLQFVNKAALGLTDVWEIAAPNSITVACLSKADETSMGIADAIVKSVQCELFI